MLMYNFTFGFALLQVNKTYSYVVLWHLGHSPMHLGVKWRWKSHVMVGWTYMANDMAWNKMESWQAKCLIHKPFVNDISIFSFSFLFFSILYFQSSFWPIIITLYAYAFLAKLKLLTIYSLVIFTTFKYHNKRRNRHETWRYLYGGVSSPLSKTIRLQMWTHRHRFSSSFET